MKSTRTLFMLLTVLPLLASCNGMLFQRVEPSCKVAPPSPSLTQECPKDLAPQVADSKGGTLLLNHQAARETYDECRENHKGLSTWTKDVVDRCVKPAK